MAQGCAKGRRNAGWLQAGAEPSASGGGGVRGLVIHNVSVLGATPASAELSWLCSNGTLHGSASAVVPPMAGCVAPKQLDLAKVEACAARAGDRLRERAGGQGGELLQRKELCLRV